MSRVNLFVVSAVVGAAAFVAWQKPAGAATATSSLAVSASVSKNCSITAGALAFGTYDALTANATTNLDQSGTFTINCTKGTAYTVSLDLGAHASGTTRRMVNSADPTAFLNYEVYNDAARTTVWNAVNTLSGTSTSKATVVTLTGYGRVPSGQDASQGSYTDTVVETVTF